MAKKTKKNAKGSHRVATFEGLPVIDGSKDIDLIVKDTDVKGSRKKDPGNCAVAIAGKRELHTDVRVYISRTYVKDSNKKQWIRFITPNAITREIISFDRGASFEPGAYTLKAPSRCEKLGYNPEKSKNGIKTGKGVRPRKITAHVRVNAHEKMIAAHPGKK